MMLASLGLNVSLTIILFILAYLIGSIPNGLIMGLKVKKIDIREHGSKNIGATNSIRVLGKPLGLTVFALDVLKGGIIIILAKYLLIPNGIIEFMSGYELFFGVVAILGHVFPLYIGFKGGKAVSCSLGVVLSLTPIPALCCLVVFLVIIYTTGYVSLGSCAAAITVISVAWILNFFGLDNTFILDKPGLLVCIVYSIMATLILIKHKKNFSRLLHGTENNFKKRKREAKLQAEQENTN